MNKKKNLQRFTAVVAAAGVLFAAMNITAYADETSPPAANVWHGEKVSQEVSAGKNGYTFLSVYPARAYEMSNHMVSSGSGNSIPQTLVMVDAGQDYTWTPSGVYTFGSSNYEVLYCCDNYTGYENNTYYKRMNLEDSTYYDGEAAAHIRAIITNSYPFVSLEQMKANLSEEGFVEADQLTRAEVISAVQMAVWAYSNDAEALKYIHTFDVPTNPQWGEVFHDYTSEMDVWWKAGKRVISADEAVGQRINQLAEHLKAKDKVYAETHQVVITDLKVKDAVPVQEKDGIYHVVVQAVLNNGGSSVQDQIQIQIAAGGEMVKTEPVQLGKTVYDITVPVKAGQTVEAVVSGTQILPEGVYFYEPEGGRDVSQSMVGVAAGATAVYAKASVVPDLPQENPVTADLRLQKTGAAGQNLAGAAFSLYVMKETDAYLIGNYTCDENGAFAAENLLPGSYRLTETAAPEGYQKMALPVDFTVSDQGEIRLSGAPGSGIAVREGILEIRNYPVFIIDNPPYEPPAPPVDGGGEVIPEPELPVPEENVPEISEPEEPEAESPAVEAEEPAVPASQVPETSDESGILFWAAMAVLAAAGLVAIRITVKKRKTEI